ncbi:GxxExxY protein [Candidatus Spyradosoma sp. SGI.093]|uniref:GxxExxY protein n=1 Tax=Candidatus Spyradosoma sp. SGI.093 TaxID=3420583 RepID=UPI003CFE36F5
MMTENEIARIAVDAAVFVHRGLGAGLLESVYETVLAKQLAKRGLDVKRQVPISIRFDGEVFEEGFRADIVLNDLVIIEIKSVEKTLPVHLKQLQTYLKLTGKKLGLLMNFNSALMKDGIARCVNGLDEEVRLPNFAS